MQHRFIFQIVHCNSLGESLPSRLPAEQSRAATGWVCTLS